MSWCSHNFGLLYWFRSKFLSRLSSIYLGTSMERMCYTNCCWDRLFLHKIKLKNFNLFLIKKLKNRKIFYFAELRSVDFCNKKAKMQTLSLRISFLFFKKVKIIFRKAFLIFLVKVSKAIVLPFSCQFYFNFLFEFFINVYFTFGMKVTYLFKTERIKNKRTFDSILVKNIIIIT